jgi:hypothetical protein
MNDEDFYVSGDSMFYKTCPVCYEYHADTLYYYAYNQDSSKKEYYPISRPDIQTRELLLKDSVYLSFIYQCGGLADPPEYYDSLIVQFYSSKTTAWTTVYSLSGTDVGKFKHVLIPVDNSVYFVNDFKFRLINTASLPTNNDVPGRISNVDHWHIDYVMLDWNRHFADTLIPDVTFVENFTSMIRDYESMPWQHWKYAYITQNPGTFDIHIRNNDNNVTFSRKCEPFCNLFNDNNTRIDSVKIGDIPSFLANDVFRADSQFVTTFKGDKAGELNDSATYKAVGFFNTDYETDLIHSNDTITYYQRFYNYYAYDDGTAEAGWGLQGTGTQYAKVAYQFNNYKDNDTLQAIYIYFNPSTDSTLYNEVYFKLTVWLDNNGQPADNYYYQETGSNADYPNDVNKPFLSGLNNFKIYRLDNPQAIPSGKFYIGWEQIKEKYLNVGIDFNRIASSHLYYNWEGVWRQSGISGALMMRPAFGSKIPLGIDEESDDSLSVRNKRITVYPNPASQRIRIDYPETIVYQNINLKLINMQGAIVFESAEPLETINVNTLPAGIYILQLSDDTSFSQTTRIIIAR